MEDPVSPPVFRRWIVVLLTLLTTGLLTASLAPFDCWYLAYVALVPWGIALAGGARRWSILWAWLAGLLFWAGNLYWLWWITLEGYGATVVYLSAYWLAAAVFLRAALRRKWPMWLLLPLAWVALEYARAYVISGFPWFNLAQSQYTRTRLIQIADVTGEPGVSFFVALVNGAILDVLLWRLSLRRGSAAGIPRKVVAGLGVAAAATVFFLGYGAWRLSQEATSQYRIGVVQEFFPISLTLHGADSQEVLASHIRGSRAFLGQECDLVIWPETMLPKGLNGDLLDMDFSALHGESLRSLAAQFFGPVVWESRIPEDVVRLAVQCRIVGRGAKETGLPSLSEEKLRALAAMWAGPAAWDPKHSPQAIRESLADWMDSPSRLQEAEEVGRLSADFRCPLLAGGAALHSCPGADDPADLWVTRNSTLWFDRTWKSSAEYAKMHLVPFSEYVPFRQSWPWLHRLLRGFVPSVMEQLDPGTRPVRFTLRGPGGRDWRIATPVCFEGTFARVCRELVAEGGRKKADILANLSNDGWFVYQRDSVWRQSNEHSQHLAQYCFRAIENRVPVVRAVNTGISASIDSSGRIVARIEQGGGPDGAGSLLLDGAREGDNGFVPGHGPQVLVDGRVSVYSLVGDFFAQVVSCAAVAAAIWLAARRRRKV